MLVMSMAHAGGRPTKYKKQYCIDIVRFFDIPATKTIQKTIVTKLGVKIIPVEVANPLPTKEGFARSIGVSTRVISEWINKHPEFLHSWERAKDSVKEILNQNALMGRYSEGYAKFVAINCTDMVDKSRQEHTGEDGGPIKTKIVIEFVDADADNNSSDT